jgi:hypothetical protein
VKILFLHRARKALTLHVITVNGSVGKKFRVKIFLLGSSFLGLNFLLYRDEKNLCKMKKIESELCWKTQKHLIS